MAGRVDTLRAWVDESPDDAFSRYALAMELKKLSDRDGARREFAELVTRNPGYCATYYHYGALLVELEDPAEARRVLKLGVEAARLAGETHAGEELAEALAQLDAS